MRLFQQSLRTATRTEREPLWKDEFSFHTANERYVNRRQFTKFLVLSEFAIAPAES